MISLMQICLFELISNLNALWQLKVLFVFCFLILKWIVRQCYKSHKQTVCSTGIENLHNQHDFIINSAFTAEIQGTVFLF